MNRVKLTRAEYTALTTKSNDTYYLIKNEGKMYLGSTQVWKEFLLPSQILTGIAITTPPAKTTYNVGETLDLTGIVVTATYLDGHTAVVTNSCTYVPTNGTTLTTSHTAVIISFGSKTASQSISVVVPTHPALCFTALEANSSIVINSTPPLPGSRNFSTSIDNGATWQTFTPDSTTITLTNIGDKVWFRGNNPNGLMTSTSTYCSFHINSGSVAASGNIMSLIDNGACTTTTIPCNYCFYNLFYQCEDMTTAPSLPATTITEGCYCNMFAECVDLVTPPALPATTLDAYSYGEMFWGCTNLQVYSSSGSTHTKAWRIPTSGTFTNTTTQENMFRDCPGISEPIYSNLNATAGYACTYYTQNTPV